MGSEAITRPAPSTPSKAEPTKKRGADDWSWIDPASTARFQRAAISPKSGAATLDVLRNIARLTDAVFDHLVVFEQLPELWGRPTADDTGKPDDETREAISKAEAVLWNLYGKLSKERENFLARQLESLRIDQSTTGLKVHIGSAGHPIPGWLNVDACNADLVLNVNWGLALPTGSARLVYCAHLLEHLRYFDQAPVFLSELHRILAPGGVLRLVVPDVNKLLAAYASADRDYFKARQKSYPIDEAFLPDGTARLDYVLFFCGARQQMLSFDHKFGYDATLLTTLLHQAGFTEVAESTFQGSDERELLVDDSGYNASARDHTGRHFSLFMEARK